eukprot:3018418-Amphidinium_carterae.1
MGKKRPKWEFEQFLIFFPFFPILGGWGAFYGAGGVPSPYGVVMVSSKEEEEAEVKKAEEMLKSGARTVVSLLFPFGKFFSDAPQPLFPGGSYAADMDVADGCFRYFQNMFKEIKDCKGAKPPVSPYRNTVDTHNYYGTG